MDEINLKNFPQDIATTSNVTKDTKVLIANGVNTYVTTLSAISKLLGVNSEKVESVSPGELPYLDTKNNRYMEVTETGDYYFEGVLLANNPRGYITIFWWDGDSWSLQSQYRVMGDGVEDATINDDGDLIITYTDGVIANVGHVKGEKGDPLPYSEWSVEDVDKLIQDVNINAQRIPAITAGELPTPTQANMYMVVTDVGAYTYGGATIGTNTDGYQTTFWWDGTAWSNNGSVKIKGDTPTGTDVLEPELIPKGKAVANYVDPTIKKAKNFDSITPSNNYVEIGSFTDGKVFRTVDTEGKHNIALSEQSSVPVETINNLAEGVLDIPEIQGVKKIVDISAEGIYAGYSDGKVKRLDTISNGESNSVDFNSHIQVLQNVSYSEWVSPLFVELPDKDLILGSPVKRGIPSSNGFSKKAGHVWSLHSKFKQDYNAKELMPIAYTGLNTGVQQFWTVDDHNAGCTLVDLRSSATKPVIVIQNDHGSPVKPRLKVLDFNNNILSEQSLTLAGSSNTYGMIARNPNNPDQIFYIIREGGSSFATWSLFFSYNNADTWNKVTLFGDGGGSDYFLSREAVGMSGIHIVGCMHPISGSNQNVVYLHLSWDGVLSDNVNGVHIPNVLTQNQNYNMFTSGNSRVLYTPPSGKRTRLHDFIETSEGNIEIVISDFTHSTNYTGSNNGQVYKHIKFKTDEATVESNTTIMPAGFPIEIPAGDNDYFAGGTIIKENTVIIARWDSKSVANNNLHIGTGSLFRCELKDGAWVIETLKELENQKFIRPKVAIAFRLDDDGKQRCMLGNYFMVQSGTYSNFGDWDLQLETYKIK